MKSISTLKIEMNFFEQMDVKFSHYLLTVYEYLLEDSRTIIPELESHDTCSDIVNDMPI